ncbi:transporter substrate-binding domain-containing protein [Marinobacter nanhaiticus D15-8W]|uniref:Solute-binding protein family 3/N-terminal domain-containing protein n=1 Tax=Marinobacter nanhaiticus D15-8W TaxID=626887 RepID=N6W046_9GAMM|nr:hypothetical protein [Marinobacter nanhaiticus]ENO15900.1 hypothetical protein J057_11126 [Marinobacter nanhaiticus D15-8W]BES73242.1 transporter substrate-binding domain-containing protein [Marinobacter nanhaiticus D15-8W]
MTAPVIPCLIRILFILTALASASAWAYDRPNRLRLAAIPANPLNQVGAPLMEDIYRQLGITIDVLETPPPREVALYQEGMIDGTLGRVDGFSLQAPQAIRIPVPLTHIKLVAFSTLEKLPRLAKGLDPPLQIGQLRGIDFGLETSGQVETTLVNTTEQLMAMLARRRIDVAIASELGGAFYVQSNNYDDVRIVAQPLKMIPVYHYLHSKHAPLVPKVTGIMQRLHDRGYLEDRHNAFRARLDVDGMTLPLRQQVSNDDLRMK